MRRALAFLAVVLAGLSLAPSYAHVLEMGPRLRWTPGLWMGATNFGGQYLLFGTPLVDHPLSMTQRALERLAHEQLARPLEARSLFERAVDSMMGTA